MLHCTPDMDIQPIRGVKGLIFDCDGVLFDSFDVNRVFYNKILGYLDLPEMTDEQARFAHIGTTGEVLNTLVPESLRHRIDEARKSFSYLELVPLLQPEEGLFELLEYLRSVNIPMAVHTNRTDTMTAVAERFGLKPYFAPIIDASMVTPKPDPEGVLKILDEWSFRNPAEAVFIGDSVMDQRAARAADVPFWAFRSPDLEADMHVSDFGVLKAVLQKVFG